MQKQKPSRPLSNNKNGWRMRSKYRTRLAARARRKSQGSSLRAGLAVIGGRTAGALSRRLHIGGGTSIVGIVAQGLYPDILGYLAAQLEHGNIVITGTNGKTTTCGIVGSVLNSAGMRVWRNREGSNLVRGIAGSLVIRALPNGQLRGQGEAISILEVDEAVMPIIVPETHPRVAVFNNLFRDQLDRYGEVDSVMTRWRKAIASMSPDATLVLNADDPSTAVLGENFTGKIIYYGIEDPSLDLSQQPNNSPDRHQVIDTRACPHCGSEYEYTLRFYSHMGHYRCPNCDFARPQTTVRAVKIQSEGFDRTRVQVETGNGEIQEMVIPLPGIYNVYNALSAAATAQALDLEWKAVAEGVRQFQPAFGRGETVEVEGRTIRLLLAKNPTGFNEVLRTLFSEGIKRNVMFVLNDNTADGKDISWIWDVDFERAAGMTNSLTLAGTRALDLGVRMKYAGVSAEGMSIVPTAPLRALKQEHPTQSNARGHGTHAQTEAEKAAVVADVPLATETLDKPTIEAQRLYGLDKALDEAIRQTPVGEDLFIVPTYTALMEVHRKLEQRGLASHYWEGKDA